MLFVFFRLDGFRKIIDNPIYPNASKSALSCGIEFLQMLALSSSHHRCQHHDFCPFRQGKNLIHDLIHRLLLDLSAADRAMGNAYPGIEKAEIVVNFCNGSHRGTGIL